MSAQAAVDPPQGHVFDTDWEDPSGIKRESEVWGFEMRVASGMLVETSERHLGYHDLTKTAIEEAFNYPYKDWLKTRRGYKRRMVPYPNIHQQTSEGRRDSRAIVAPRVWINNLDTKDQTITKGRDQLRQPLIQRIKAAIQHVRNNPGEVERNWNAGEVEKSDEEGADAEEMTTSDAPQPQRDRNTVDDDINDDVVAAGRGDQERDANRSTRRNPVRATARSARYNQSISDKENSHDEDLDGEIGRRTKRRRVASDPDANLERSRGGLSPRPLINSPRSPYHIRDVVAAVAAKPPVPLHVQKRYSPRPQVVVQDPWQTPEGLAWLARLEEDTTRQMEWDAAHPEELARLKREIETPGGLQRLRGRHLSAEQKGEVPASSAGPRGSEQDGMRGDNTTAIQQTTNTDPGVDGVASDRAAQQDEGLSIMERFQRKFGKPEK